MQICIKLKINKGLFLSAVIVIRSQIRVPIMRLHLIIKL